MTLAVAKRFLLASLAGATWMGMFPVQAAAVSLQVSGGILVAEHDRDVSRSEAARRAQSERGGKILSVDDDDDGYRVKLLEGDTVRTVRVPGGRRRGDDRNGGFDDQHHEQNDDDRGGWKGRRGRRGGD